MKSTAEENSKFLRMKTNELSEFEGQLEECRQVISEQEELYNKLKGDVKDYDELLPESKLEVICPLINRISQIYKVLTKYKKQVKEMNANLNALKIRIGDLDIHQACREFVRDNDRLKERLYDINKKTRLLENNCKEFEGYASDKEQRKVIKTTKMQLHSFLKTISVEQTKWVEKLLDKLKVVERDYDMALNKDVLRQSALKQIAEIDQRIQKSEENVEQSWQSLAKKCQHFQSFDLAYKWQKRHKVRTETATVVEQVKNEISLFNVQILDKLDSNISVTDK